MAATPRRAERPGSRARVHEPCSSVARFPPATLRIGARPLLRGAGGRMRPATPYRIAYVIGELGKGGAEYQLHELLRHLDRALFEPRVFVLAPGGWWTEPIRGL